MATKQEFPNRDKFCERGNRNRRGLVSCFIEVNGVTCAFPATREPTTLGCWELQIVADSFVVLHLPVLRRC
jgi:hypothetical protein